MKEYKKKNDNLTREVAELKVDNSGRRTRRKCRHSS